MVIGFEIHKCDVSGSKNELEVSSLNQVFSDPRIGAPWFLAGVMHIPSEH